MMFWLSAGAAVMTMFALFPRMPRVPLSGKRTVAVEPPDLASEASVSVAEFTPVPPFVAWIRFWPSASTTGPTVCAEAVCVRPV